MTRKIATLLAILFPAMGIAQSDYLPPNVYLSAFVDRHSLGVTNSGQELDPVVLAAALGYWVRPGIGIELELGTGVKDDHVGSLLDVDFESKLGVNLRLESPPAERYSVYALFSYVRTNYDLTDNAGKASLSLPGGRIGLGATYMLTPQVLVDAAFTHHDYDIDTRINSFRLGVRFEMGVH